MLEEPPIIRPAHLADMNDVGGIVAASWHHTFRGILPDTYLTAISPDVQADRHKQTCTRDLVQYYVATVNSKVIGFVSFGPSRGSAGPQPCEIYALYISPEWAGRGVGRQLLQQALSDLATSGASGAFLTALSANPNLPFYEKLGGTRFLAPKIYLGKTDYNQVGFEWVLRDESRNLT